MSYYQITVQRIIQSLTNITFEFDIDELEKEIVLEEVPISELKELGKKKVQENFNSGTFKIKMPNGNIIDSTSIYKHSIENNIIEPVIFINSEFKYVQWVLKKDYVRPQIKKHIKNQLTNNNEINLEEVQKALLIEDIENKKIEGDIDNMPIKTSNHINKDRFYIQSSCSRDSAIEMLNEVISELKIDAKAYIKSKCRRDYKNLVIYVIFIVFITSLWIVNKQCETIPLWLSNTIGVFLFLVPLVVMKIINHSFFDTLLFPKKNKKKYEKEFYDKNKLTIKKGEGKTHGIKKCRFSRLFKACSLFH
jgi:hypothetical protein